MAAAAMVNAGLDVLMTDATAVLVRNPLPFLRGTHDAPPGEAAADVWMMRGG